MTMTRLQALWPVLAMLMLYLAALYFRPLLPIDETRYMSVAWEMLVRDNWLSPLTVNFAPYHHKPPLLFWLINSSWSVFGVSRWAALLPLILISISCIYLTKILAKKIFVREKVSFENIPFLVIGSLPFLIYNTLVMFDVTLTLFVLLSLLALIAYAARRSFIYILLMAAFMGLGVLTKGPVAWLHVIFPILLAPVWLSGKQNWWSWYGGCFLAILLSAIPVLLWLIPVLKASSPDFAFSLVWTQTAGRITGSMDNAHTRPFYFYLPLLPVLFLPWILFPSFWSGARKIFKSHKINSGIKFICCWILPLIITFSLIGGKQPHYLLPLLPGILILISYMMNNNPEKVFKISVFMVLIFIAGQALASPIILKKYDLQPVAEYIQEHPDKDLAFIRRYHGEFSFLARLNKSFENEQFYTVDKWFDAHPNGIAVVRYNDPNELKNYKIILNLPYRGKYIAIFERQ